MKRLFVVAMALVMTGGLCAGAVKWEQDYDSALRKAKNEKKLVMVDVYTDWCGWCKKLDKDVYTDKDVRDKLEKGFIAVKINAERGSKNKELAQKFGTRGYPHIVFVDADGKKIDEIGGYVPADKFAAKLDKIVEKSK